MGLGYPGIIRPVTYPGIAQDKYVVQTDTSLLLFSAEKMTGWSKSGLVKLVTLCILFYTKYQRDIQG